MKQCNTCKQTKELTEFHRHATATDGRVSRCKVCSKEANKNWFSKAGKSSLTKRRERIRGMIELSTSLKQQTGCVVCGENEDVCLDWHHIDPSTKTRNISSIIENLNNQPMMLDEIKKCVCLCSNCHKKVHAKLITHSPSGQVLLVE